MAERDAFDLWAFLGALSKRDAGAYEKLTPEGKKAAAPFVIMRWMTGTSDAQQLIAINRFVNPYVFSMGHDKGLLFKLMAAAASGRSGRYQWLKGPGSKADKLRLEVIKQYYIVSTREAVDYIVDGQTIMAMAEELGWEDDQLKKLKKELE